eukprot:6192020-Pleurochrysis_carterae.AAC.2
MEGCEVKYAWRRRAWILLAARSQARLQHRSDEGKLHIVELNETARFYVAIQSLQPRELRISLLPLQMLSITVASQVAIKLRVKRLKLSLASFEPGQRRRRYALVLQVLPRVRVLRTREDSSAPARGKSGIWSEIRLTTSERRAAATDGET